MPICFDPRHSTSKANRISGRPLAEFREHDANCIDIGLVNNMPGTAMQATERQFHALLDAASDGLLIRLTHFALPDVPRTSSDKKRIADSYSNITGLWDGRLDGLIVTGTEPVASNLKDEPYWGSLTKLVDWAEHNTHSAIWSCLAAHAAVLHLDDIARRPFSDKLCGLFECSGAADDRLGAGTKLTAGLTDPWRVPHSRWNDIPEEELVASGYHMLTRSQNAGADAFVKQSAKPKKSLFVFFQGHPEYENDSLLLEYRRDIRRFLKNERTTYPSMPANYFSEEDAAVLNRVRERVLHDRDAGHKCQLLTDFPAALLSAKIKNTWRPAAASIYRNWLFHLSEQKACELKAAHRDRALKSAPAERAYQSQQAVGCKA